MLLPRQQLSLLFISIICAVLCSSGLAAPAAKHHAAPLHSKPPQQTYTATIPFEYDPILMPYIVVQVSINGQPQLPFVVDTGTSGLLLTVEPWAAKKLNLPILDTQNDQAILGQSGQYTVQNTIIRTIKIVGNRKNNVHFNFNPPKNSDELNKGTPFKVVAVLAAPGDAYQIPHLAGIIPCNLLSVQGEVWQIDFQKKLLTFTLTTKKWKPALGSFVVPLKAISTGDYSIWVALTRGKHFDFLLDTGNPFTSAQAMASVPFPNGQSAQTLTYSAGHHFTYDTVVLPQLQLDGLTEPSVAMHETDPGNATSSPNIIGTDFLSRFLVTLDFADNKMYLKRRSDYASLIVPPGRANVRLEKQGTQYVTAWVQPGSPADLAGLHLGDQITAVDGQALQDVPLYAAQNLLDGQEGTRVTLQAMTADKKTVTLSFMRSPKFLGRRHALLGVSVEWVKGYLMVAGVTPGSPLDGILRYDDDIDSINGQSVSKMTSDDALRLLERPDLVLQVWRSSDKTWQDLHLAPLPVQTQVLVGPVPEISSYTFEANRGWTAVPLHS